MLESLTAFFTSINPLIAVLGAGIGALFTYAINAYISHKARQQQAVSSMQNEMDQHAGDGAQSVDDMKSAQAQIEDLKTQGLVLDQKQGDPPNAKL